MPKFSSSSLGRGFRKSASIADIASSYSISNSHSQEDAGSFSSPSSPSLPSPHLPPSPFRSPPSLHPPPGPSPLATSSPIIASPKPDRSKRFRFFSLPKRHLRTINGWETQHLATEQASDGATPPPNTPQPDTETRIADKLKSPTSMGSMRIPIAGLFRRATATGHGRGKGRTLGPIRGERPDTPIPTISSTWRPTSSPRTQGERSQQGFRPSPSDYHGMEFDSESELDDSGDDDEDPSSQYVDMVHTVSHIQPSRHRRFAKVASPVLAGFKAKSNHTNHVSQEDSDHDDEYDYATTTTYDLIDPFDPILTSVQANNLALHLIENSQSSAGSSVILLLPSRFSMSESGSGSGTASTSSSRSGLPTPPIILSAPTPPHAVRITTSESYIIRSGEVPSPSPRRIEGRVVTNPFGSSLSRSPKSVAGLKQTRSDLFAIAHTLQHAARHVESDPSFNQHTLFKSIAPIVAFLYALLAGVLVPRYMHTSIVSSSPSIGFPLTSSDHTPDTYSTLCLISLSVFGLIIILTLTRVVIQLISLIGQSFCGMDVEEALKTGECVDTKGGRVSQADLLVGGILGR